MQKSDNIKKKMGDEPQFGYHPHCEHIPVKNPETVIQWLIRKYKELKKQHLKDIEEIIKRFEALAGENTELKDRLNDLESVLNELKINIDLKITDLQGELDQQKQDLENFKAEVPSIDDFNSLADQVTLLNNQVLNFYEQLKNYYNKEEIDTKLDNITKRINDLVTDQAYQYMRNRGQWGYPHDNNEKLDELVLSGYYNVGDGVVLIFGNYANNNGCHQVFFPHDFTQSPLTRKRIWYNESGETIPPQWTPWEPLTPSTDVDLSNYFTKDEINNLIENLPSVDLSNYYTKDEINNLIDNFPTTDLSNYFTKDEINNLIENIASNEIDLSNYYTKGEVNEKTSGTVVFDFNKSNGEIERSEEKSLSDVWLVDQEAVRDVIKDYNSKLKALDDQVNYRVYELENKVKELQEQQKDAIQNINVYDFNGDNAKYKEFTLLPWNTMINYYVSNEELEKAFPFIDFGDLAQGTLVYNVSILSLSTYMICFTNVDSYISNKTGTSGWRKITTTRTNTKKENHND